MSFEYTPHPANYQISYFVAVLSMTSAVEMGAKRCQSTPILLEAHEREEKGGMYYYQHPRFENLTSAQMAFLVF